VQTQHECLHLDTHVVLNPLSIKTESPSEINSFFSYQYYVKGNVFIIKHSINFLYKFYC